MRLPEGECDWEAVVEGDWEGHWEAVPVVHSVRLPVEVGVRETEGVVLELRQWLAVVHCEAEALPESLRQALGVAVRHSEGVAVGVNEAE